MRYHVLALCVAGSFAARGKYGNYQDTGVWMGGDMHLHSNHSDDAKDNYMDKIVAKALERGLDFFVCTDHDNHVDGDLTTWDDPLYYDHNMTTLYGVEWTSGDGHANFFSAKRWDHPALYRVRDEHDGQRVSDEAARQGLVFSINHPSNAGSRVWELGYDFDFQGIEVWQSLFLFPTLAQAEVNLWESFLQQGRRITGRGGSDCHHQETIEALGLQVGNPTNWIFSANRSGEAVIEGFLRGRVSVSYAPEAERIELRADGDGDGIFETLMGDNLPANGQPIELQVTIARFQASRTYKVAVFKNGQPLLTYTQTEESVEFFDTPAPNARTHYRVEVRSEFPLPEAPLIAATLYGDFVGFTNPIYVGF